MNRPALRALSVIVAAGCLSPAVAREPGIDGEEITDHVLAQAEAYFAEFQHPETGVLYGARLSGKDSWTSPDEVLREMPKPWGYGSRIADTVLHTGHMLVALLDAWGARPDPFLEKQVRRHFEALRMIGSLPETHPKPGKPALEGLVVRGPHPDNRAAYFDDSSMDQHTTYLISLALFSRSDLATEEDRAWIAESLGKAGRRLERHGWAILRADGKTQAHVGFSWKGFNSGHASILLPAVLALAEGTGDPHWRELYEFFLAEANGKRWQLSHPGPHVRINGHPIYANQNAFRVNAWYRMETDPARREVIAGLLRQSTEMQLARDFPGEFYRKYHSDATWERVREDFAWDDAELHGAEAAWEKFRPEMLDHEERGLAALSHVRFPLGGFHMALLSENDELVRRCGPMAWDMLRAVDLEKVGAGETHYLFTVVGLHLYALAFSQPELFAERAEAGSDSGRATPGGAAAYGPSLERIAGGGIGGSMDVVVEGDRAYAIGGGKLSVLDLGDPRSPTVLGRVAGLGSVRQIVVSGGIAYVSSRQDGLFVVDVTDPAVPGILRHYDTVEFATGLALSGEVLFVACRHYGVELVDVSDPANPRHLSTVRTGEAQSVVARNGYLYTGVWATSEVVTVDVRDPWNPRIVHRAELDGFGDGVEVRGDYLYAVTGHHSREQPRKEPGDPGFGKGHGIEIFDLADPARPRWISRLKFPALYEIGNDMWSVTVSGGRAFVADTWNGIFVVDVSDPAQPFFVARWELPRVESCKRNDYAGGLAVVDDHVLVAGGSTDLHVLDAGDLASFPVAETDAAPAIGPRPPAPAEAGWEFYRPGTQVHGIDFLKDDRAVVACGSGGIHLLQLWPEIRKLAEFSTDGFATDVSVDGDRIYVAEGFGGLGIFTIEGDNQARRLGRFEFGSRAIRQVEVPGVDDLVMVQAGANQFLVVDAADPAAPELLLEESRHGLLYGDQMMRGLVDDRYTCVFWHVTGIHWFDLRARPRPAFSGDRYPERLGSSNGLAAFGDRVLAPTRGGYLLLERGEARSAAEIGITRVGDLKTHLGVPTVDGDRLYLAMRAYGIITVADIGDPETPVLLERIETPGNPTRIAVRNETLVIPDGYHGLRIRRQEL